MDLWDYPDPNLADAEQARDAALTQVEANADDGWKEYAWAWLLDYLRAHAEFFPDDVWAAGLTKPRELRALGPLVQRAARLRYIVQTGRHRKRTRGHATAAAVWRSMLCEGERTT